MTDGEAELARNKRVVAEFLDLLGQDDIEAAFDRLTDDVGWFSLTSRRFSPKAAMKARINWVSESLLEEPIRQDISVMTAEGNRVAVMSEGHAMTKHGVEYNNLYHFLFELRDGLISRIWEYNDTMHIRDVLLKGATIPPGDT